MLTRKRTRNASSSSAAPAAPAADNVTDTTPTDEKHASARSSPRKSGARTPPRTSGDNNNNNEGNKTAAAATTTTATQQQQQSSSARTTTANTIATITNNNNDNTTRVPVGVRALEAMVLRSHVIAPDVSGIRCVAVAHGEDELLVARENASLVSYRLRYFQGVPHMTPLRHTGGRVRRTVTRVHYTPASAPAGDDDVAIARDAYVVVSYLSGQVVLYDRCTLAPVHVCERSGGAVWDMCLHMHYASTSSARAGDDKDGGGDGDGVVHVYGAMASNAWHVWRLRMPRRTRSPVLELLHILPGVPGATRALSVTCAHATTGVTTTAAEGMMRRMQCLVVGTDDGGNVHAWQPHGPATAHEEQQQQQQHDDAEGRVTGTHGLSSRAHTSMWVRRLPKGIALCCAIATGVVAGDVTAAAVSSSSSQHSASGWRSCCAAVAVGTSLGEVVLLHATHGALLRSFALHKGPVSTVISDGVCFYASGWHESLRCYRCLCDVHSNNSNSNNSTSARGVLDGRAAAAVVSAEVAGGEWYAAEVKRRTHYHEATQLLLASRQTLMLSAARDGTLLYAPVRTLFTQPALYLAVTTQQFAFAQRRNALLQTRHDRIEAFVADAHVRHWTPLFAHRLAGCFHVAGLWCDAALRCLVASTDERAVVVRVHWRDDDDKDGNGSSSSSAVYGVRRLEEVVELPTRRGVIDVCCEEVTATTAAAATTTTHEQQQTRALWVYVLSDDGVAFVTPCAMRGSPVVYTRFAATATTTTATGSGGVDVTAAAQQADVAHALRPMRVLCNVQQRRLTVYGMHGTWQCALAHDGTPQADTQTLQYSDAYTLVHAVPTLSPSATDVTAATTVIGLRAHADAQQERYYVGIDTATPRATLAATLPHDTHFIARLPLHASSLTTYTTTAAATTDDTQQHDDGGDKSSGAAAAATTTMATSTRVARRRSRGSGDGGARTAASSNNSNNKDDVYLAYFARGLLIASSRTWRMAARLSVEAAFVMRDGEHVLVLERNVEKALESLPLCWKVRRFGN